MRKLSYAELNVGLDQLYMQELIPGEQIHDRMETVENYIRSNGWTYDEIISEMINETPTTN